MQLQVLIASILLAGAVNSAIAEKVEKRIAGWVVSVEKDPFGTDDRVIVTKASAGTIMGFRCFRKSPQIAVLEASAFRSGPFVLDIEYSVKLRVDERPIINAVGNAVSPDLLQIETDDMAIFSDAAVGRELNIKIEYGGRSLLYRLQLSGAAKALPEFYRACNLQPVSP